MFPYWTSTVKPELLKVIKPVYLDKEDHFAAGIVIKIEYDSHNIIHHY